MRKKKKANLFAIGCFALLLIGFSFALWTGKIGHTNELKAHKEEAKIEETFKQDTQPSGTVQKEVSFKNDSSGSVFLRVSYAETWEKTEDGNKMLLNNQLNGKDVATKNWKNGFAKNSDLWMDGEDGWFYYKKILKSGKHTENVLETVSFPEYVGDYKDYQDAQYQLYFRMEILQASDSQSTLNRSQVNKKASQTIFGKEATVNGETVEWQ